MHGYCPFSGDASNLNKVNHDKPKGCLDNCHCTNAVYPTAWPHNNTVDSRYLSKSKGPSKKLRDIRTSTYQMCSSEEKQFEQPKFTNDYVI